MSYVFKAKEVYFNDAAGRYDVAGDLIINMDNVRYFKEHTLDRVSTVKNKTFLVFLMGTTGLTVTSPHLEGLMEHAL